MDRGLFTLKIAGSHPDSVTDWSLGRRNHALLELHALWFGHRLEGWTSCSNCGEKIEFELDARQLAAIADTGQTQISVVVGEHMFRLPTSRDVAHVAAADDEDSAVTRLLERCRISGPEKSEWTNELVESIGERLASADPLAETRIALTCPSCRREWDDVLDIGCFVWAEVEARARRLLWEIHSLAAAYGWSEAETLALNAARRAMYLEMVHR